MQRTLIIIGIALLVLYIVGKRKSGNVITRPLFSGDDGTSGTMPKGGTGGGRMTSSYETPPFVPVPQTA